VRPPNVVLILADDLGYSDLGCYGGEIRTPTLDRLAMGGVRLTSFYNTARCSPSRASLLTGLHPHQTGIGILTNDDRPRGYPGTLNDRCSTMAETLGEAGYATCLSGKWHLSGDVRNPNGAWPTRRGFNRFYGTLTGCGSYYHPGTLTRGERSAEAEALDPGFFYTDAISDEAGAFIRRHRAEHPDRPFFLYAAYTAPHWPLHAPEEDIEAYAGVFDEGWDALRQRRMERLAQLGVAEPGTKLSDRDPTQPAWDDEPHQRWQVRRMQAYAAQVERMDRGIGRIVAALEQTGCRDDTLVVFLSDNGASPERLPITPSLRFRQRTDILRNFTRDGRLVDIGNDPEVMPGGEDTYASYGRAWANLSNTPFRYYKKWVHEGGIAAPFVVNWPNGGLMDGRLLRTPFQLTDVLPTVLEATGVPSPVGYGERELLPLEGRSMLSALRGQAAEPCPLYWEHCGNAAIRRGRWKLVRAYPGPWELYDIDRDPTELVDLAGDRPGLVADLAAHWERWAGHVGVAPFDEVVAFYRERGLAGSRAVMVAAGEDVP
jgi:arylsulfatase A-like enzyme